MRLQAVIAVLPEIGADIKQIMSLEPMNLPNLTQELSEFTAWVQRQTPHSLGAQSQDEQPAVDTGLGVYIHVPFCRHECPYCDFTKFSIKGLPASIRANFPGFVAKELAQFPATPPLPLKTLYLGGGTPSLLVPESLELLLQMVENRFGKAEEVTLEANPENITESRLNDWHQLGINRLSVGIQSFDDRDLLRLERLHKAETLESALGLLGSGPIANWSGDLMFALPNQTEKGFLQNLERLIAFKPCHVSFYGLTLHDGTPFFEQHRRGELAQPEEEVQETMYREGHAMLQAVGFEHYEVSNFAQPGKRSRHNQRYWQQLPVLGFGPGAWSQWGTLRWMNEDDYATWTKCLSAGQPTHRKLERCTEKEQLKEILFAQLRQKEGFPLNSNGILAEILNTWFASPVGAQVVQNQWIVVDDFAKLSLDGWLRWDAIVAQLDRVIDDFALRG
ncbi:MAG: radical SAM family heme chaperone HemW [Sumerlaeia bacterium]